MQLHELYDYLLEEMMSKPPSYLTLHLPTLPPPEHYKGRYFPSIDLLRWAEILVITTSFHTPSDEVMGRWS